MRYAENCEQITVHSFYAIIEKDDFRYIIIGWDEYSELLEFDEEKARKNWNEIYNEYCKLSQDNQTLLFFELQCELIYLENRLFIGNELLNQLEKRKNSPEAIMIYGDALIKWKLRFKFENDVDSEIAKLRKDLVGSENKIRLKKNELEGLVNEDNEEGMSLSRQLLKMSIALKKDKIDARKTSMVEYIDMLAEIKEINEIRSKNGSKLSAVD